MAKAHFYLSDVYHPALKNGVNSGIELITIVLSNEADNPGL
jgi:hypothetical protein